MKRLRGCVEKCRFYVVAYAAHVCFLHFLF